MPRYVLLHHEMPPGSGRASHWDFMLEHEGILWTWAMEGLPEAWCEELNLTHHNSSDEIPAQQLSDHRLGYLEYEGPVSGNRGKVTRCATGEYSIVERLPNRVEIRLAGTLQGTATLTRESETSDSWMLRIISRR